MDAYLVAVGFALLPALGNFGGGLLAEHVPLRPATERVRNGCGPAGAAIAAA